MPRDCRVGVSAVGSRPPRVWNASSTFFPLIKKERAGPCRATPRTCRVRVESASPAPLHPWGKGTGQAIRGQKWDCPTLAFSDSGDCFGAEMEALPPLGAEGWAAGPREVRAAWAPRAVRRCLSFLEPRAFRVTQNRLFSEILL